MSTGQDNPQTPEDQSVTENAAESQPQPSNAVQEHDESIVIHTSNVAVSNTFPSASVIAAASSSSNQNPMNPWGAPEHDAELTAEQRWTERILRRIDEELENFPQELYEDEIFDEAQTRNFINGMTFPRLMAHMTMLQSREQCVAAQERSIRSREINMRQREQNLQLRENNIRIRGNMQEYTEWLQEQRDRIQIYWTEIAAENVTLQIRERAVLARENNLNRVREPNENDRVITERQQRLQLVEQIITSSDAEANQPGPSNSPHFELDQRRQQLDNMCVEVASANAAGQTELPPLSASAPGGFRFEPDDTEMNTDTDSE